MEKNKRGLLEELTVAVALEDGDPVRMGCVGLQ